MAFPPYGGAVPALAKYQASYNGLFFGGIASGGVYTLVKMEGLGMEQVASGDMQRPRDTGELAGLDVLGGRDLTITVAVKSDGTSLEHAMDTLAGAFVNVGNTEVPFFFARGDGTVMATMCRPRKFTWGIDNLYVEAGGAQALIQLHATDPRIYSTPTLGQTVSLPSNPGAGLQFPITFPVTFGAGTVASILSAINSGNVEMRPQLVLSGPVTNPSVTNTAITGSPTMTFSNPNQVGYTVLLGDQLLVDLDAHSILYYAGGIASGSVPASYPQWITPSSTWWNLVPGVNQIQFTSADSGNPGGTLTVQWASASLL